MADPPTATAAPAAPAPTASRVTPAAVADGVRRLVGAWSQAWQNQDVEVYISQYSRRFAPADGTTRTAWVENRRERLTAPEFIEITLTDLEIEWLDASKARATFNQRYRSNTFQDNTRKVLELVQEDGSWKILEEKTAG
jgi:murein L,D-transpeptidase YafK